MIRSGSPMVTTITSRITEKGGTDSMSIVDVIKICEEKLDEGLHVHVYESHGREKYTGYHKGPEDSVNDYLLDISSQIKVMLADEEVMSIQYDGRGVIIKKGIFDPLVNENKPEWITR